MKDKLKDGYTAFCNGTSMHGFTELYGASSLFWKFFWVCIISFAMGVTSYQVYESMIQYMYQSTSTTVEPAANGAVLYPPLKYCLSHWIDWVDESKYIELNFSREALLYSMSFLLNIYINGSFNQESAKSEFMEAFQQNNFTTVSAYYKAIAHPVDTVMEPWAYFYRGDGLIKSSEIFTETEFNFFEGLTMMLCYVAPGQNVKSALEKLKQNKLKVNGRAEAKNILELDIQDTIPGKWKLTTEEHNSYMAEYIKDHMTNYNLKETLDETAPSVYALVTQNYSNAKTPRLFFVDGYSDDCIDVSSEVDVQVIKVKASAHVWMNSSKNPCIENMPFIATNTSCEVMCSANNFLANLYTNCVNYDSNMAYLSNKDTPDNLCTFNIFSFADLSTENVDTYVENQDSSTMITPSLTMKHMEALFPHEEMEKRNEESKMKIKECVGSCRPGCEKWTYEMTFMSRSMYGSINGIANKMKTRVKIEYPVDGEILVTTEIDTQSWETFVANIGGLLGIWTGASILSIIQLFYLCCISKNDDPFNRCCKKSEISVPRISKVNLVRNNRDK